MGLTCPLWFLYLISLKNSQRWRFWVIAIFWTNIWLIFWQVTDFGHLPPATCQKSAIYWSKKSRSPKFVIFDHFSTKLSNEIKVGTSVPRTSLIEHVQAHYFRVIISLISVSPATGFEPGISWSAGRGTTTDLHQLMYFKQWWCIIFHLWPNSDFNSSVQPITQDRIQGVPGVPTSDSMGVAVPPSCILIFSFHFISYHINLTLYRANDWAF